MAGFLFSPTPSSQRTTILALGIAWCALAFRADTAEALFGYIAPSTPPGWSAPAVPRNIGDATEGSALLPTELDPTSLTYISWAVGTSTALSGQWHDELLLDGQLLHYVTRAKSAFEPQMFQELNSGPVSIPGGRHTLAVSADVDRTTSEFATDRGDNQWQVSLIWRPQPLASGTAGPALPPEGTFGIGGSPSCDAWAFTRTPGTAWVVSTGTGSPDAMLGLAIYGDYTSATDGLSQEVRQASRPGFLTDFIVGAASGAPATLYPAIARAPGSPAHTSWLAASDAAGRQSANASFVWPSVSLPTGQSAQVFEAYLAAGVPQSAVVTRFVGNSDLELLAYPPGMTAATRAEASWTSAPRANDDEYDDLAFVPDVTGWYLFVVARVDGSFIGQAGGYRLELFGGGLVGAEVSFADAPLTASPSPAAGPVRLAFALARPEHVRLEVFDLAGRAVRRLEDGALPAGPIARVWDGRDDRGIAVAPGRYWARLSAGARRESVGIARIR